MNFLRNLIQGSQSASKADAGLKKKGPTIPLDFAGPPGNPEQEAEGQKDTPVITRENTCSVSPLSSPSSLPSEASSRSLSKECDTTSTTEDISFASCLTEAPSCASELSPTSPVKDLTSHFSKNSGEDCTAEKSINSVSDSVAQNNAQNGVKKDSEYESAEELDLPLEPTFVVTVQPSSNKSESPVTNEAETTKQEASVTFSVLEKLDDTPVHEESPHKQTEIIPVTFESPVVDADSITVILDKESDNLALEHCEKLPSTVCDSLVTVTKTEIIEESLSKNKILSDQQVTNSGCEVNGVLSFNICAQLTENQNRALTLENSTVNSEESGNIDVEIENCQTLVSESRPENLIKSEIKESDDQLDTPNNCEYKVKDNETNSDLQFDGQIASKDSESECESVVQTDSQIHSEGPSNLNTSEVTVKDNESNSNLQSDNQIASKTTENVVQADNQILSEDESNSNTTEVTVKLPSELVDNQQINDTVNNNTESAFEDTLSSIQTLEAPQEEPPQPSENFIDPEDIPIIPQKSYNLDFLDNLDDPNFNPFATKTYIRSSPPPSPEPGCQLPPLKPAIQKRKLPEPKKAPSGPVTETKTRVINGTDQITQQTQQESNTLDPLKLETDNNLPVPHITSLDEFTKAPENQSQSVEQNSEQLLNITFDEPVSRPPRKLGKKSQLKQQRPPTKKAPPESKLIEKNNNRLEEKTVSEPETKFDQEELPIPPSKGYNLDFLDNLDDPNFNPFATKCSVSNSPPKDLAITEEKSEDKPKPKASPPKKSPAKKGCTVIKNKAKTKVPAVDEADSFKEIVNVLEDSDKGINKLEDNLIQFAEEKEDIPIAPKKDYNLDFLDDPNFDPFQSRSSLDKNTSTVHESDSSNEVPKDIDIAKVNSVNSEAKSVIECDKDSATESKKQVENNKESLSQAPQKELKGKSLLVINKEETRETSDLIKKEDKPEVIEANAFVEETHASLRDIQDGEEKSLVSQEEICNVIDSFQI